MLKAALTHIVQQNKQKNKARTTTTYPRTQTTYLLKQSGNYFYRACLLNLPCFIMAFGNPFRSAVFLF